MFLAIKVVLILVWIYLLSILKRGKLGFFHFIIGTIGMFLILLSTIDFLKQPIIEFTGHILGYVGNFIGMFSVYPEHGIFFVNNKHTVMSLYLDLECSGIIEIITFLSLVLFFPVYNFREKIRISLLGVLFLYLFNFVRIILILTILYFCGTSMYPLAHSFIGRIVFYILTILLYFKVFTQTQINRQKVGNFDYVTKE